MTPRALGWPGEHWCSSRTLGFSSLTGDGYEQGPSPALSPVTFSCAKKMPSSVWLFFPAGGAESLLFLKEKLCLPLCGEA